MTKSVSRKSVSTSKKSKKTVSISKKSKKTVSISKKSISKKSISKKSISKKSISKKSKTPNTKNQWIKLANVLYDSHVEVRKYQNIVKKDKKYTKIEQKWVDDNLQPIIDLLGYEEIWKCMIPDIEFYGLDNRISSYRKIPKSNKDQAYFSGTHWYSRKANQDDWFNSYTEYQVSGTNQFCQTFALLYLLDALPPKSIIRDWHKYYEYTKYAIDFIENIINTCLSPNDKKIFNKKIKNCQKYYAICLNSIEFSSI